jgi:YesN/AraC family two-component response regulator
VLLKEDSYDAVKAYDVGVFDYLLKPVDEKQLIRVMVKYMLNQKNLVKLEKSER